MITPTEVKELAIEKVEQAEVKIKSELNSIHYKELIFGEEHSNRRYFSFLATGFLLATSVRVLCFSNLVFGEYLTKNLGPVERESVKWIYILLVRFYDLILGSFIWRHVQGSITKDGVLFGVLIIALSRVSLYAFEYSYFLLSPQTTLTVLATDILSLTAAFSLLPTFLPRSVEARPSIGVFTRLEQNRELVVNVILAYTLATTVGGLSSFVFERLGGFEQVKISIVDIKVPSILSADTLSTVEMMRHPLIKIPILRSTLEPGLPLLSHLGHSFISTILSIPLVTILPKLKLSQLSAITFGLIFPTSTILLWDVLPITLFGALGVGLVLAIRGAITTAIVGFTLEELRSVRRVERVEILLVDDKDQVVKVIEQEIIIEDGVLDSGVAVLETSVDVVAPGLRTRKGVKSSN